MVRVYLLHSWRTGWRALLVLALVVGIMGGAALAAFAGARRSASALERFEDGARTLDVFIAADVSTPEPAGLRPLLEGPLVDESNDLVFLMVDIEAVGFVFAPTSRRGLEVEQGVVIDGRRALPEAADEVTLSEGVARAAGLDVGDTVEIGTLTPAQTAAMFEDGVQPTTADGPLLRLQVVGIVRNGFDLGDDEGPGLVLTTPAMWERYGDEIGAGSQSHMVRLVDEPGAVERFTDGVEAAYGDDVPLPSITVGQREGAVADTISVITAALVAVGGVTALAGLAWVAAAAARHQRAAVVDLAVLRSIGATRRMRRALLVGSVLPALAGGLVLAMVLAVALSPLLPVGEARRIDPDLGLQVDAAALLGGGLVLGALLVAAAVLTAAAVLGGSGPEPPGGARRVPRLADRAARLLPPAPAAGVRFALSAPARTTASVRPALGGAVVAMVGIVAVAVVGSSLQRTVDTPARWGTTWDVAVAPEALAPEGGELAREALVTDPEVEAAALLLYDEQVTVDGVEAISMTFDPVKGSVTPTVLVGREPRADDEIALGRDTLEDVGAQVGDTATVRSRTPRTGVFRIVGVVAFPTIGSATTVARGATLTAAGGGRLGLGERDEDAGTRYVALRWAPWVDGEAALAARGIEVVPGRFEGEAVGPTAPPEVAGLRTVRRFPLLVGGLLLVLGVVATIHGLLMTVRRRRRDLGVLSALGLAPRQRRGVVLAQSTTIAVVAVAVGGPVGVVVGRLVWSAIARAMGLGTDASFPFVAVALGSLVLVTALTAVAALPASAARRLRVAEALRAE